MAKWNSCSFKNFALLHVSFILVTGDLTHLLWQNVHMPNISRPPPVYESPPISFSLRQNQSPITLLLRGLPTSPLTTYYVCVQILWVVVAFKGKA